MDVKRSDSSPVLTDPTSLNNSRIGLPSRAAQVYSSTLYSIPRRKVVRGTFDDARANGWLDSMKSSSPPRKHLNLGICSERSMDETDVAYHSWMKHHPSALTSFEQITSSARCKKIALFLDYDGTLSPIVDNPDFAVMPDAMRIAVKRAAKYFPTAIISGRSREKVFEFVKLTELYYAGSHGMDIMGPAKRNDSVGRHLNSAMTVDEHVARLHLFQPAREFLPMIDEVFSSLIEITKDIVGAKVENNKFCLSVHYRLVDEEVVWPEVAQRVFNILEHYPRLRITHGRKVLEIRPVINWNKGNAVEFLLESLGLRNRDDVISIYIGDDKTDEDAFEVLGEGKLGYGVLVSSVPKETKAIYSLRDPSEVMEFLHCLVRWKASMTIA